MEFSAPEGYTINGVPVKVVATPSRDGGEFTVTMPDGSTATTEEIGFSRVTDSDARNVGGRDTRVMGKYVLRTEPGVFRLYDGGPVIDGRRLPLAECTVIER